MIATAVEAEHHSKEAFSECFQHWRHSGRSVWSPNETTLMVIRFPALQVCLFFRPKVGYFSNRPRMIRIAWSLSNSGRPAKNSQETKFWLTWVSLLVVLIFLVIASNHLGPSRRSLIIGVPSLSLETKVLRGEYFLIESNRVLCEVF